MSCHVEWIASIGTQLYLSMVAGKYLNISYLQNKKKFFKEESIIHYKKFKNLIQSSFLFSLMKLLDNYH